MQLVDRAKLRWHMDLASSPTTHGWVLNLYRAGEQHPQTVHDYFPHQHAPWPELARSLQRHAADERRHTKLYGAVIERMGQPVEELRGWDVFNRVIREHTPVSFAISDETSDDEKRRRLAHFLAHAHCLEKRVLRSVEYHLEACERVGEERVSKAVQAVHADEARHVAYTLEALRELVSRAEADALLDLHGKAEAAADRAFSAYQVRSFLARHGRTVPLGSRLFYAVAALLMDP